MGKSSRGLRTCHFKKQCLKEDVYITIIRTQCEGKNTFQQCDTCSKKTALGGLMMLSETCLLTAGNRKIKGSLRGSIRPKTDATAGRVDTHSAGMRSQVALRKVQSPGIGKAGLKIYLNSTTMYRYIFLQSNFGAQDIYLKGPTSSSVGR